MGEEFVEPLVMRRVLEDQLAALASDARGEVAAKRKFKREALFLRLQLGMLGLFEHLAAELGRKARLDVVRHDPPGAEIGIRLSPTNPRAARIQAYPDADDTVYLGVGEAGCGRCGSAPPDSIGSSSSWRRKSAPSSGATWKRCTGCR